MKKHAAGRHRAPGHNPLRELRDIALDTANPAIRGAAFAAAVGGLAAATASPAQAAQLSAKPAAAPVVAGPTSGSPAPTTALATFGVNAPAVKAAKPIAIRDIHVEQTRAAATKAAAAKAAAQKKAAAAKKAEERRAAAKKAAADRAKTASKASRSTSRTTLTKSTYTPKSTGGTRGATSSYNWATAGQCTWGALNLWKKSTGFYLGGFTGNAHTWDTGAARAGYTVSGTPRARSIIVLEPGVAGSSSVGHVAWVTSVSGNRVTFTEMNGMAGEFRYNTRTITDGPGMKYIYAP